jgi:hypothetical protein
MRLVLVLCLCALGCALFPKQKASMLSDAGFRIVAANTPEKIQALNTLPANRVSKVDRNGETYYVYADTGDCRCLRVGREEQYQRYLRISGEAKSETLETTGANTQGDTFKGYEPW